MTGREEPLQGIAFPGERWFLWEDCAHTPAENMAIDDLLLSKAPYSGTVLLRIYRWDRPAVSIGLSQTYPKHLADRYSVVRRPTGGGIVFHDGDVTYTVVAPPEHPILTLNRMESYRIFHEVLLELLEEAGVHAALQSEETPEVDRLTMSCFVSPSRFDIVDERGEKFAGAAQRRTRSGLLHQGSIRLDSARDKLEEVRRKLPEAFAGKFALSFMAYRPEAELLEHAAQLAREKYETCAWNQEKKIL